jgi:hypothetical protein
MKKNLPIDPHRKNSLWAILNERPIKSNNPLRSNQFERNATSVLPSITSPNSRRFEYCRSALSTTQKTSNLDALYRIALQNQTAYKSSIGQTHVEKRKLFDKQFATQHPALSGTNRVAGLVK